MHQGATSAEVVPMCPAGQHPIPILDMKQLLDLEMALMVQSTLLESNVLCLASKSNPAALKTTCADMLGNRLKNIADQHCH